MGIYKVDRTAVGIAKTRSIEYYHAEDVRLFQDPYALEFFPQPLKWILHLARFKSVREFYTKGYDKKVSGLYGGLICRTRYIDDALTNAIHNGIESIVILGAGLDARAYRIPGINQTKVFEVDQPYTLNFKKEKITNLLGSFPSHVTHVPIDFNQQALGESLASKGLDLSKPAFFIWEGVTQYITADAVKATLQFVSNARQGSELVFTYILRSVVEGTSSLDGADYLLKTTKKMNAPWVFGIAPSNLSEFLKENNLILIEDIGASFYQEKYLKPIKRNLDVYEIERIAYLKV